jgi:hypothetical protein
MNGWFQSPDEHEIEGTAGHSGNLEPKSYSSSRSPCQSLFIAECLTFAARTREKVLLT